MNGRYLRLQGSEVRTCTSHDDSPHILVDYVQRRNTRAFRITVAEVIQALALCPIPNTAM
jgi:hypothetical protein